MTFESFDKLLQHLFKFRTFVKFGENSNIVADIWIRIERQIQFHNELSCAVWRTAIGGGQAAKMLGIGDKMAAVLAVIYHMKFV